MPEALRVAWESAPGMSRAFTVVYAVSLILGFILNITNTYVREEFEDLTLLSFFFRGQYWLILSNPFVYSQNVIAFLTGMPIAIYLLCKLPQLERIKGSTGLLLWLIMVIYVIVLLTFAILLLLYGLSTSFWLFGNIQHPLLYSKISGLYPLVTFFITKDCITYPNGQSMFLGIWPITNKLYPGVLIIVISLLTWNIRLDIIVAAILAIINVKTRVAPLNWLEASNDTLMKVEDNLRNWFMPHTLFNGEYIPIERSTSYTNSNDATTEMANSIDNDGDLEAAVHSDDTIISTAESNEVSMVNPSSNNTPKPLQAIRAPLMSSQSNMNDNTQQ